MTTPAQNVPNVNELWCALDTLAPNPFPARRSNVLCLRGWCVPRSSAIQHLRVLANGQPYDVHTRGLGRPDVWQTLGRQQPDWRACYYSGFSAALPLPVIDRDIELTLEATLRDGRAVRAPLAVVPAALEAWRGLPLAAPEKEGPFVALCLATHRPPLEFLRRQLASIQAQTHRNWVCLISDDASPPETRQAIAELIADDARFHLLPPAPQWLGFYRNFERCLSFVPPLADFVGLADQDDYWYPHKLATLLAQFGPRTTLAFSDMRLVDEHGQLIFDTYWTMRRPNATDLATLLLANSVPGAGLLMRRELLADVLPFPPEACVAYHDHWIGCVALARGELAFVPEPLYDYTRHGANISGYHSAPRGAWPQRMQALLRSVLTRAGREHARTAAYDFLQHTASLARAVELRGTTALTPEKRMALQRLAEAEHAPLSWLWLFARGLKDWRRMSFTDGAEYELLQAIAWKHLQALRVAAWPVKLPLPDEAPPVEPQAQADAPSLTAYQQWLSQHEPTQTELAAQRQHEFAYRPLISIVTPIYRTPPDILCAAIESVRAQTYAHWELCLVDGGSDEPTLRQLLEDYAARDARVRVTWLPQNLGIAENTNAALRMCTGEFVALLDHDDELAPHALFEYVQRLNADATLDVLYSDEDKLDAAGARCQPFFKPDWSPEYLRGVMYVGHLLCFRRSLWEQVGGFDARFDGVQDFEFMLRLSEATTCIAHVPKLLYHWRALPGSVALDSQAKPGLSELQRDAVNAHLQRVRLPARAEIASPHHQLRSVPNAQTDAPIVSIVIAHRGTAAQLEHCVQSIAQHSAASTHAAAHEVLIVSESSAHLTLPGEFTIARACNFGAKHARGAYLLFLSSALEVQAPGWLEQLRYYAAQAQVGVAGGLILDPAQRVVNAGYVLDAHDDVAALPQRGEGYPGALVCARELTAVSGQCLMTTRSQFDALGGFNEYYRQQFFDVDYCLRLRATGQRVVFTPQAVFVQHAEALAHDHVDQALLLDLWQPEIERGDPYHNPLFPAS